MKIEGKIVTSDYGKVLNVFGTEYTSYTIGLNGATLSDIKEGKNIPINGEIKFIPYQNYGELVTNLIRTKYSLDEELALMANSRIKSNSEEEIIFQQFRKQCKLLAKKYE